MTIFSHKITNISKHQEESVKYKGLNSHGTGVMTPPCVALTTALYGIAASWTTSKVGFNQIGDVMSGRECHGVIASALCESPLYLKDSPYVHGPSRKTEA